MIFIFHVRIKLFILFSKQDFAIEDVLSEYDTDKDGFISLKEFIGDVRGDGKTTKSEYLKYFFPDYTRCNFISIHMKVLRHPSFLHDPELIAK